jgi:cobalt-zinc-cadmium efflux system protein
MGAHHNHSGPHNHAHGASEKAVLFAAALTGSFMLAEITGGLISGSLALLADAGHMLTDFAALSLAYVGFRLARRPADGKRSYGFDRFSVLVAFVNGIALFAIAGWIVVEAIERITTPVEVLSGTMLIIACLGLVVNIAVFWVLSRGDTQQLNMRAALLHVLGDLLGSVAAIIAALIIMATGWLPIDPILSVLVALIILRSAWYVVHDSANVLLEGTPKGIETEAVRDSIMGLPFVIDVHHVHAWSISEERPMVTLHAQCNEDIAVGDAVRAIKARLSERFHLDHATVEIEYGACADAGSACGEAA